MNYVLTIELASDENLTHEQNINNCPFSAVFIHLLEAPTALTNLTSIPTPVHVVFLFFFLSVPPVLKIYTFYFTFFFFLFSFLLFSNYIILQSLFV